MQNSLHGEKIAILIASGFYESEMTMAQRALQNKGAKTQIVSTEQSLVNSWTGLDWGHHFAVDCPLNTALAADFSMLVVPGGKRSVEKLMQTAHTKRFISGFINDNKPLAVFSSSVELLDFIGCIEGRKISCAERMVSMAEKNGAQIQDASYTIDQNLLTSRSSADVQDAIEGMLFHFENCKDLKVKEAA